MNAGEITLKTLKGLRVALDGDHLTESTRRKHNESFDYVILVIEKLITEKIPEWQKEKQS